MKTPPMLSGGLPVVGHALAMMRDRNQLFQRGYETHGEIFTIKLGPQPAVVLGNKAYNRVFYTETDKALNISEVYEFLRAALGEVLFTANAEAYDNQRPVLLAVFKRERMERYITAMNTEIRRWLDGLGDSGKINITDEMLNLTQRVVAHAFLGPNFDKELDEGFWQAYMALSESMDAILPPHLPLPKFIRRDRGRKYIREVFDQLVAKRRQHPDQYDDMITLLLTTPQKDGEIMSDDEIATLFTGLIFAGHETTAGQAAWTIIQLLQHPDYLATVQDEISQQITPGETIDAGTLHKLNHVFHAIDETTRLRPSADIQMRLVEDPIEIGDYTIPAGWRLIVTGAISNHHEDVFTEPEKYDPLRHSPERKEASDPFSVIAFGGGIHRCTGMNFAKNEMAIITSRLFDEYDLTLETPDPHVVKTVGANRPSPTIISYRRKSNVDAPSSDAVTAEVGD